MGQLISTRRGEFMVCLKKYNRESEANSRERLLHCLKTNDFRDIVGAAENDSELSNAFVKAAYLNHADILEAFCENGINVDIQSHYGFIALIRASDQGFDECVRLLLDHRANVDIQNEYGHTALIVACLRDKMKTVEILLERDADVNIQDKDGRTALMHASRVSRKAIVEMLLNHGADINLKSIHDETVFDYSIGKEIKEMLVNHVPSNYVKPNYILK